MYVQGLPNFPRGPHSLGQRTQNDKRDLSCRSYRVREGKLDRIIVVKKRNRKGFNRVMLVPFFYLGLK